MVQTFTLRADFDPVNLMAGFFRHTDKACHSFPQETTDISITAGGVMDHE